MNIDKTLYLIRTWFGELNRFTLVEVVATLLLSSLINYFITWIYFKNSPILALVFGLTIFFLCCGFVLSIKCTSRR